MNRNQLFGICRDFLGGTWKSIGSSQFNFQQIKGGLSNLLYLCSLPDYLPLEGQEPRQVMIRQHLRIHNKLQEENIVFTVLSEREIGPKLHGVFDGGRIEQYIPSNPLQRHDMWKPNISTMLANELAVLHNTPIPIKKDSKWLMDVMQSWVTHVTKDMRVDKVQKEEERKLVAQIVRDFPFDRELAVINELLHKVKSPVVFCHNDLQENNVLVPHKYPHLMFIDYEYASYNYRTYDIANHFCEWTFDYAVQEPPNFVYLPDHFPSSQEQQHFIKGYLNAMIKAGVISKRDAEIEALAITEEVPTFAMISSFLWALWGLVQAEISSIEFGYGEYAATKLHIYRDWKLKVEALSTLYEKKIHT